MNQLLLYTIFLCTLHTVKAQFPIPVPTWWTDALSQRQYDQINIQNTKMGTSVAKNSLNIAGMTTIIGAQNIELFTANINPITTLTIINFVSRLQGFSGCYGYLKKKYPILNPIYPRHAIKNKLKRTRFFRRLSAESSKIKDYMNLRNPIPEGERILLTLTALENAINITLEK